MSWTLTTSGLAISKAGAYANSAIIVSGQTLEAWSNIAEGRIEAETRRTWVDNYAGLSTGVKGILSDVASSLVAIQIINYDMSGFTSRAEAQTMLDVNDNIVIGGLTILKDFKSNELQTP